MVNLLVHASRSVCNDSFVLAGMYASHRRWYSLYVQCCTFHSRLQPSPVEEPKSSLPSKPLVLVCLPGCVVCQ